MTTEEQMLINAWEKRARLYQEESHRLRERARDLKKEACRFLKSIKALQKKAEHCKKKGGE